MTANCFYGCFSIVFKPDDLVGSGTLFICVWISFFEKWLISYVWNIMVTPFPEIVLIINAISEHSLGLNWFHVDTLREDRLSPGWRGSCVTTAGHVVVTAERKNSLNLLPILTQNPYVIVKVISPTLWDFPIWFHSYFVRITWIVLLVRHKRTIDITVETGTWSVNVTLIGDNNDEIPTSGNVHDLFIIYNWINVRYFMEIYHVSININALASTTALAFSVNEQFVVFS